MSRHAMEGRVSRLRFETCPTDFLIYAAPSAVDRSVLCSHNDLERFLGFDVTRKTWKLRNNHNDLHARTRIYEVCFEEERIMTLNFFPDRAALRMRSTSAAAI